MRYLVAIITAALFAAPAIAQDQGFYAGLSLGQTKVKDYCGQFAGTGVSCDDKDTAWKVFGGYQFNRHFAAELGYTDLGEAKATFGGLYETIKANAFELVGVGMLPVVDRFSVFAKLGLYRGETEDETNFGFNAKETNTDITFGFGARYDFGKLGVFGQWQRYADFGGGEIGESDVDVISIGLLFKF
jgi:OmpA-OmpF porin, OOP family